MILSRRRFLHGIVAAPIVVRSGLLMPVKTLKIERGGWYLHDHAAVMQERTHLRWLITGIDAFNQIVTEMIEGPSHPTSQWFKSVRCIEQI